MKIDDDRTKLISGDTAPNDVATQHNAVHIATKPPSTTTRRCKAMNPETTAPSPKRAARLNAFEPMTTPAPIVL